MDLTTRERVRAYLDVTRTTPSTATLNAWIDARIAEWSRRAVQLLGREVTTATYTETFDARAGQRVFSLKAYPVASVVSVREDLAREFTGATIASDSWSVQAETGLLRLDGYCPSGGPGTVQVVYRGGMAPSAASFAETFPDIAGAIDEQVVYAFERKTSLGRTAVSAGPGSVTYQGALDWLPHVRQTLLRYRRVFIG